MKKTLFTIVRTVIGAVTTIVLLDEYQKRRELRGDAELGYHIHDNN